MFLKDYIKTHISDLRLDFLTIRLNREEIAPTFWGIVQNSPIYNFDNGFLILELDTYNNKIHTYNLLDTNRNKLAQIMITSKENDKFDYYDKITFYGTFYNLGYDPFYEDIFKFFGITSRSSITRFDIKLDISNITLDDLHFKDTKTSRFVRTRNITTWKIRESKKRYKFRIYDKKLDIIDNNLQTLQNIWGEFPYDDMLKANKKQTLIRLETQINSNYIKVNKFLLSDVFNQDTLYKIFNNLLSENLVNYGKKIRSIDMELSKLENISNFNYTAKLKRSKQYANAYLKKLYLLDRPNFRKNLYGIISEFYIEESRLQIDLDLKQNKRIQPLGFKP